MCSPWRSRRREARVSLCRLLPVSALIVHPGISGGGLAKVASPTSPLRSHPGACRRRGLVRGVAPPPAAAASGGGGASPPLRPRPSFVAAGGYRRRCRRSAPQNPLSAPLLGSSSPPPPRSAATAVVDTPPDPSPLPESPPSSFGGDGDGDGDGLPGDVYTPAFRLLGIRAASALIRSDLRRNECNDGASTGWTAWVDEGAASELREAMEDLRLAAPSDLLEGDALLGMGPEERATALARRDAAREWSRWMRSAPAALAVDLSGELRAEAGASVTEEDLRAVDSTLPDLLSRCGCALYLLPSGGSLPSPLRTPPGSMAYGKVLYGGCRRFRLLPGGRGPRRRAGERTSVAGGGLGCDGEGDGDVWLQYGGPERSYEAIDMGPCAVLEAVVLPRGLSLPLPSNLGGEDGARGGAMELSGLGWDPLEMFESRSAAVAADAGESPPADAGEAPPRDAWTLPGAERNDALRGTLSSAVGGLRSQIDSIVRRVLDGRAIRPTPARGLPDSDGDESPQNAEAAELAALGLKPVRGLLLHGPPGCGKTALAREISGALRARPPVVVSAPELLDRWVGGSEKIVRSLFAGAEAELRECGGDATRSALHVVVIDEIDAVFRRRGPSGDGGDATRASCVNQILSKLDGVDEIPNVLVIGMTNRKELLDEALLRPGRLEVQVEIPPPDGAGRREILQIHFDALRRRGRLSRPLCRAIDGETTLAAGGAEGGLIARVLNYARRTIPLRRKNMVDLSAQSVTGGFTGADLAGLVRCAGSIALSRARQRGDGVDGLLITLDDVMEALREIKE